MIQGKVACIAKTLTGLEGPLEQELLNMGFENVKPLKRGVQFDADLEGIYRANLNLRTAMNILMPVKTFKFRDKVDFHKSAMSIPWEEIFDLKKTFLVRSVVFGDSFDNSLYPALLVKDAVADRFRNKFGKRPNVDKERPDIVIDAYINDYQCIVSLNSSGTPLYQRGYRNISFEAPLNECLAAGLVYLSGWDKTTCHIEASDLSNRAISTTRNSLINLGLEEHVKLSKMNIYKAKVNTKGGTIILNPPYDERLKEEDIDEMYAGIGRSLKFDYQNHTAWIFSSNIEALKNVGLKTSTRLNLKNGKLPCKFMEYRLYEGSLKD